MGGINVSQTLHGKSLKSDVPHPLDFSQNRAWHFFVIKIPFFIRGVKVKNIKIGRLLYDNRGKLIILVWPEFIGGKDIAHNSALYPGKLFPSLKTDISGNERPRLGIGTYF